MRTPRIKEYSSSRCILKVLDIISLGINAYYSFIKLTDAGSEIKKVLTYERPYHFSFQVSF